MREDYEPSFFFFLATTCPRNFWGALSNLALHFPQQKAIVTLAFGPILSLPFTGHVVFGTLVSFLRYVT